MAFTDITTDTTYMRNGNDDVLIDSAGQALSDTDLSELNRYNALKDLELDLLTALNISPDDSSLLDDVYEVYATMLSIALTIKQLIYFYLKNNSGVNSASYNKLKYYEAQYRQYQSRFASLMDTKPSQIDVGIAGRIQLG